MIKWIMDYKRVSKANCIFDRRLYFELQKNLKGVRKMDLVKL